MESETTLVRRSRFRLGALRFSVGQFLIALVLLLVTEPFVEQMEYSKAVESALMTLVMLSAVLAIGAGRRTLVWAVVLVIPAIVGRWANHVWPGQVSLAAVVAPALLFLLFVVAYLLRFILRAPRVTTEVLYAGIATYLMLGLLWALAYVLVNRLVPDSFVFTVGPISKQSMVGFNGLYFSFITLSTVGYGDIVPVSSAARMLAMTEAMTGTIYLAVLISRLVALYSSENTNEQKEKEDEDKTV
jgi:voltage-gated potassium channel